MDLEDDHGLRIRWREPPKNASLGGSQLLMGEIFWFSGPPSASPTCIPRDEGNEGISWLFGHGKKPAGR